MLGRSQCAATTNGTDAYAPEPVTRRRHLFFVRAALDYRSGLTKSIILHTLTYSGQTARLKNRPRRSTSFAASSPPARFFIPFGGPKGHAATRLKNIAG